MLIERIKIKNFGCYAGEQTIDFPYDKKNNIILLLGCNGGGKTMIMRSLKYLLYDVIENEIDQIITKRAAVSYKSRKRNTRVDVYVEVRLQIQGEKVTYRRGFAAKYNNDVDDKGLPNNPVIKDA